MHDYLTKAYDGLNDSPMQRHFRALAPMPFGVVFLPWDGLTEPELRRHFRLMKELGFTNLKQVMPAPGWPAERLLEVALDEGILPFWYGEGGWAPIDGVLLDRLGIPRETPMPAIREHPAMRAHQAEVLRKRIRLPPAGDAGGEDGVELIFDPVLREDARPLFVEWVKRNYSTIEDLNDAWNMREVGIARDARPWESWEDFESDPGRVADHEYRHVRDILRFKADHALARLRLRNEAARRRDPAEPQRAGGEMGLFLPFAWRGTDMEGIAGTLRECGSFYPSIHLAWHFEEAGYETTRCVYMQASLAADWFKGGWSATWESTGGPQQFSGGKGWHPKAADETAGFTVDAGVMGQLMLSYLAAGFRGAGLWAWNCRRAGWEAGEYQLLDRNGEPCARTRRAGRIAKAANRLRDELWQARKEPYVGVFVNWDNEAIWAAISQRNRDHFRHFPIRARVGAARALINGNVPWEHVTARDVRRGLAARYRAIFLPAQVAINRDLWPLFDAYVRGGGRLLLDAPGGWFDERGKVMPTGGGSDFERLFGVCLRDYQYSANVPRALRNRPLSGWVMEMDPTSAEAIARFDDGAAAVTLNRLGRGAALVLGYEASHALFRPGRAEMESWLCEWTLGGTRLPYRCRGAIAYRLAAPAADHYFLMNDGHAAAAVLETEREYAAWEDAETGERLVAGAPVALEACGARWLRMTKAEAR
jgi:beta-galactosidase